MDNAVSGVRWGRLVRFGVCKVWGDSCLRDVINVYIYNIFNYVILYIYMYVKCIDVFFVRCIYALVDSCKKVS